MTERLRVRVQAGAAVEFFSLSPKVDFCADSYSVSAPPHVTTLHIKDPGHSAKSAGGRLHLHTHTPWVQRSRSGLCSPCRHSVGTYQGNKPTRN